MHSTVYTHQHITIGRFRGQRESTTAIRREISYGAREEEEAGDFSCPFFSDVLLSFRSIVSFALAERITADLKFLISLYEREKTSRRLELFMYGYIITRQALNYYLLIYMASATPLILLLLDKRGMESVCYRMVCVRAYDNL